jgi:vacuolar-type H+-ATPase subunit I/STV1
MKRIDAINFFMSVANLSILLMIMFNLTQYDPPRPPTDLVMESQKNIDDRDSRITELEHAVKVHRQELATLKAKVPSLEYHAGNAKKDLLTLNEWHDSLVRDLDNKFRYMYQKFEDHGGTLHQHADKFNAHDTILFRHGVKIDKLEVDALPWEEIKQKKPDVICVPPVEESSEGNSPS